MIYCFWNLGNKKWDRFLMDVYSMCVFMVGKLGSGESEGFLGGYLGIPRVINNRYPCIPACYRYTSRNTYRWTSIGMYALFYIRNEGWQLCYLVTQPYED